MRIGGKESISTCWLPSRVGVSETGCGVESARSASLTECMFSRCVGEVGKKISPLQSEPSVFFFSLKMKKKKAGKGASYLYVKSKRPPILYNNGIFLPRRPKRRPEFSTKYSTYRRFDRFDLFFKKKAIKNNIPFVVKRKKRKKRAHRTRHDGPIPRTHLVPSFFGKQIMAVFDFWIQSQQAMRFRRWQ
jgi:hypothetical protein